MSGQAEVQQDEVVSLALRLLQRVRAGPNPIDPMTLILENLSEPSPDRDVVLHDQYAR